MMVFHISVYGCLLNYISCILIHFLISSGLSNTRFIYGSCNIIRSISKIGRSIVAVLIYRSFMCQVNGWAMIYINLRLNYIIITPKQQYQSQIVMSLQFRGSSSVKTLPNVIQQYKLPMDESINEQNLKPARKREMSRNFGQKSTISIKKLFRKEQRRYSMKVISYPLNHINCWVQPEAFENKKHTLYNNKIKTEAELRESSVRKYDIQRRTTEVVKKNGRIYSQQNSPTSAIVSKSRKFMPKIMNVGVAKMLLQQKLKTQPASIFHRKINPLKK